MFTTARNYGLKPGANVSRSSQLGFTLIEAMVAVAVFVVLATVGIPSFRNVLLDNRRTTVLNDLVSSIAIARSETARRALPVHVCGSLNGASCSNSGDWGTGWIVIADIDTSGGTEVLKYVSNDSAANGIRSNQNSYNFQPFNVRVVGGTVTVCDSRGPSSARAVVIAASGVPRISTTDGSGAALTCL